MEARQHPQYDDEREVVQRENPQRTASIEAGEVPRRPARFEQESGDEKSRENKEQVHAHPATLEDTTHNLVQYALRLRGQHDEVECHDRQDGEAAYAVEGRNV